MADKKTREQKRVDKLVEKAKKSIYNREKSYNVAAEITGNPDAMLAILAYITQKYWGYDYQKDGRVEHFVELLDKELLKNADFVLKASEMTYDSYGHEKSIVDYIQGGYSKDVALALVKKNPKNLRGLGKFKGDEDVVMVAVKKDGSVLGDAANEIRDVYDVVRAAVANYPDAIQYASDRLKNDVELGKFAVRKDGSTLRHLSNKLKDNKDVVLIAVEDPKTLAINYASERLRDDYDVAITAVRANGNALGSVSVERRSDHAIVSEAINSSPSLIKSASNRYLYSEPLLFKAVLQDTAVLEFVPEEMRKVMVEMLDNYEMANPDHKAKSTYVENEQESDL